jgi:hypothetical protein
MLTPTKGLGHIHETAGAGPAFRSHPYTDRAVQRSCDTVRESPTLAPFLFRAAFRPLPLAGR